MTRKTESEKVLRKAAKNYDFISELFDLKEFDFYYKSFKNQYKAELDKGSKLEIKLVTGKRKEQCNSLYILPRIQINLVSPEGKCLSLRENCSSKSNY